MMDENKKITFSTYRIGPTGVSVGKRQFVVPQSWAEQVVAEMYGMSLEEFLLTYTWDDTEPLYWTAKREGVILDVAS